LIRAVTFDLWNTIFSDMDYSGFRIELLGNILAEEGFYLGPEAVSAAYASATDYAGRVQRGAGFRSVPASERVDHVLEGLGVRLPSEVRGRIVRGFENAIFRDPPPLKRGVEETLEALGPRFELGIVSDSRITPGSALRRALRFRGVHGFFASTVFSDEVGFCKPHAGIFGRALGELGVEPSEAVHVGDLLQTDVEGAKAVGMRAV